MALCAQGVDGGHPSTYMRVHVEFRDHLPERTYIAVREEDAVGVQPRQGAHLVGEAVQLFVAFRHRPG